MFVDKSHGIIQNLGLIIRPPGSDPVEKLSQSSQIEVQELLREMFCTLEFCINAQIQHTVKRYCSNTREAIAFFKEVLRTSKKIQSPEAVFVVTCKEDRKPWHK